MIHYKAHQEQDAIMGLSFPFYLPLQGEERMLGPIERLALTIRYLLLYSTFG